MSDSYKLVFKCGHKLTIDYQDLPSLDARETGYVLLYGAAARAERALYGVVVYIDEPYCYLDDWDDSEINVDLDTLEYEYADEFEAEESEIQCPICGEWSWPEGYYIGEGDEEDEGLEPEPIDNLRQLFAELVTKAKPDAAE